MRKVFFVAGFATGYVLGARAGRARYEQIARQWGRLVGSPEVQQAADTAKRVVTDTFAGKDVTDTIRV